MTPPSASKATPLGTWTSCCMRLSCRPEPRDAPTREKEKKPDEPAKHLGHITQQPFPLALPRYVFDGGKGEGRVWRKYDQTERSVKNSPNHPHGCQPEQGDGNLAELQLPQAPNQQQSIRKQCQENDPLTHVS